MKKSHKMFIGLLLCAAILFSGLVLNYGGTKNLSLIDYHPMSCCHISVPFGI